MPPEQTHHLLCTHCTYATSALEVSTAANADKVLGYSVRASSIPDAAEIQAAFRSCEHLLSYALPAGIPQQQRTSLTADTSPLRFCYIPDSCGRQFLGQIAYRAYDTAKRPGSYFAHFLSGDANKPWRLADCLRLFGVSDQTAQAGWCSKDQTGQFCLTPIAGVPNDWAVFGRRHVSEENTRAFLSDGSLFAANAFDQKTAERWKSDFSSGRRTALAEMIAEAITSEQSNVSLVVHAEPTAAAHLFFAAIRILPTAITRGISFSTFEPRPLDSAFNLVASPVLANGTDEPQDGSTRNEKYVIDTYAPETQATASALAPGLFVHLCMKLFLANQTRALADVHDAIALVAKNNSLTKNILNRIPAIEAFLRKILGCTNPSIPTSLSRAERLYLAVRCSQTIHARSVEITKLSAKKSGLLLASLRNVFTTAPELWTACLRNEIIATWEKNASPTTESSVMESLRQPESVFSNSAAAYAIATCDCVQQESRLPLPSDATARLWGSLTPDGDEWRYTPQPLLLELLKTLPPNNLKRLLPEPLPSYKVGLGIAESLALTVSVAPFSPEGANYSLYVRQIMDEMAGDLGQKNGLSDQDFEQVLAAASTDCKNCYDPIPGRFADRVARYVLGFPSRLSEVCGSTRLVDAGYRWHECHPDAEKLKTTLAAWKTVLSFFASCGRKNNNLPYSGQWTSPESEWAAKLRDSASTILQNNSDTDTAEFLKRLLDQYVAKDHIFAKGKPITRTSPRYHELLGLFNWNSKRR